MKSGVILSIALLAACSKPTDQISELSATEGDNTVQVASQAVAATNSRITAIDDGIATLQKHNAEDPAKMQRLISTCQAETGAVMEGEGAMQISSCVNSRW